MARVEPPIEALRQKCSQYSDLHTVQLFDAHLHSSQLLATPLATGVLVKFRELWLVITASHVLDSPQVKERGLYVITNGGGGVLVDLGDFSFTRTGFAGDRISDDDIDLAIVFLDESIAHRLTAAKYQFVEFAEAIPPIKGLSYSSLFFVHGYPVEMTDASHRKKHIFRTSLAVFLPRYDQTRGMWPPIFKDAHIDLDYEMDLVVSQLETGRTLSLPHPSGFSGCGLWHVAVPVNEATFDEVSVTLAGIVHRFNEALHVSPVTSKCTTSGRIKVHHP
jgi:hypothetical protein